MPLRDPIKIDSDQLLLCEGKTTLLVLGPLGRHFNIQGFQPFDFGSKDNFGNFLRDIKILPGFESRVRTLAIVRDAEISVNAAFDSVRNALNATGLPAPNAAGEIIQNGLRVGVFIVPDNQNSGMIETLCMQSVEPDPAFACVDQFFECVNTRLGVLPTNMHKARAQTFLATRREVDYHVGRAADNGIWNFDHGAFAKLADFLRQMAA